MGKDSAKWGSQADREARAVFVAGVVLGLTLGIGFGLLISRLVS